MLTGKQQAYFVKQTYHIIYNQTLNYEQSTYNKWLLCIKSSELWTIYYLLWSLELAQSSAAVVACARDLLPLLELKTSFK